MSVAVVHSRAQAGIDAPEVTVEVHLANGLPGLFIVGLAETEVREAKDRVRGALANARFDFPLRRITVNLAPADLPKEGGRFDLPIAIGILAASGQIPAGELADYEFAGELALTGGLRPIRGALPAALKAGALNRTLVLPVENAAEATLAGGARVLAARHLLEITAHLNGTERLTPSAAVPAGDDGAKDYPDLDQVRGQHLARRALEIAAAGGHSLLFIGPPGSGKTMLASRLPGVLPPMTPAEALEAAAVQSLSRQGFRPRDWGRRPFRAPHHTASGVALVGGGSQPMPGEISLAHHGVLFLDELPEFDRRVLEVLREPLESGRISISRAARQAEFPARFQLVAAMNPCPCGYLGDPRGRCRCTAEQIRNYRARISGPLLDRIDLQVQVPAVPHTLLLNSDAPAAESSASVRARVERARARQLARAGCANAQLDAGSIEAYCVLDAAGREFLHTALARLGLSARALHRVLRVARSVADLAGRPAVTIDDLAEALQFRCLDRNPN
jgi:magnesium chelatase family protein